MAAITAIAALASAAAGLISSQYANQASREQMEKYRNMLGAQRNQTEEKIQRLENEDALQTRQGSALANEARETIAEQNAAAAGRDAVSGGTGVNAARTKVANTDILRKTYRDIIMNHEASVGARLANLEGVKANYDNLIAHGNLQQANANAQSGSQAIKGAAQILQAGAMAFGGETSNNGTDEGVVKDNQSIEQTTAQQKNTNDLSEEDKLYEKIYGPNGHLR